MKKLFSVFVCVLATLFILAGCSDLFTESDSPDTGFGTVIVNFDGGSERTIVPGGKLYDLYYVLTFTSDGKEDVEVEGTETNVSAKLLPGSWTVDVKGYLSGEVSVDEANALVTGGPEDFTVVTGKKTAVNVDLTPNADRLTQIGSGKLALAVTLPAGANGVFKVLSLDEAETSETVTMQAGKNTREIELDSGFYHVVLVAELNGKEIVWRELAQIYDNAVTKAEKVFTTAHFTQSSESALINAFDAGVNTYSHIDNDAGTISVIVPTGTDITSLSPAVEFEGAMIRPAPGGAVDLSTPQTYTVYTANGEEKTYTVTAADTIESAIVLAGYLGSLAENTAAGAYPVRVTLDLDTEWQSVLSALGSAERFVDLDISESWGMGTFDPGTANTGEKYIAALVLPETTTATEDVPNVGTSTPALFQYFSSLAAVKGAGLKTLGAGAFKGVGIYSYNLTLKSYDFPALESIGAYAFFNCSGLTGALTIPDSVTSIGDYVFYYCSGLSGQLTIPAGVTSIGRAAFNSCSGLTGELIIPNSVTSIGISAFGDCTGLTGELIIPNSVTSIGASAFFGCSGLTGELIIPNSVTSIGGSAFYGCSGLSGVTIPDSVTSSIGDNTFYGCSGLSGALTIPASVTSIGRGAFYGCSGLNGPLTILNGATSIGAEAFYNCTGLNGPLTIPGSVTSIGTMAFYGCSGLSGTLTISEGVKYIMEGAFEGCTGLSSVSIPGSVWSINDSVFRGCSGLSGALIIPEGVGRIEEHAFAGCVKLTALNIPASMLGIVANAFYSYKGTKVIFGGDTIVTLDYNAFPGDLAAKYKAGKAGTYTRANSSYIVWTKQP